MKVGDMVTMARNDFSLDLYPGDKGIIQAAHGGELSVHFIKWRAGDRNWRSGVSTHRVNGVEAFYFTERELKLLSSCMFNKGGDDT